MCSLKRGYSYFHYQFLNIEYGHTELGRMDTLLGILDHSILAEITD